MSSDRSHISLEEHPQLRILAPRVKDRRVPIVRQQSPVENSAACLTSVLRFHKLLTSLDKTYGVIQRQVDPTSDEAIVQASRRLGLRARRLKLPVTHLQYLPRASLLHCRLGELVVFDSVVRNHVRFMHPARGRVEMTLEEFSEVFLESGFQFETLPAVGGCLPKTVAAVFSLLARNRSALVSMAFSSLMIQLLALSIPLLTALIVERVAPQEDGELLFVVAVAVSALIVFRGLSAFARQYAVIGLQAKVSQELTLDFLNHLCDLPYSFFEKHGRGDLLVRMSANDRIREFATGGAITLLLDGMLTLLYLVLLLVVSPLLGVLIFAAALIQVLGLYLVRRRLRPIIADIFVASGNAQSAMLEMIDGLEIVKSIGATKQAISRWLDQYSVELKLSLHRNRLEAISGSIAEALRFLTPLLVLLTGAFMVLSGDLGLGEMLALSALAIAFITPFTSGVEALIDLQLLSTYIEKLDEVRTHPPEQDRAEVATAERLEGAIVLDRVGFRYGAQSPPVLREVSLNIRPGEFVALVGGSGAGKSTLASMLVGLRLPTDGRVLFDGVDIKSIDMRSLRQQIGVVPQNVFLLGGASIRENIALGHTRLGFDRIVEAAKFASVHEDIVSMPMGYETLVPFGGAGFSGGQKQRFAIARAIAHRPAIIIFDEATSALDTLTEKRVKAKLEALGCTRIIVAHRLSTVLRADRIIVMDKGEITAQGTHQQLLKSSPLYSRLVAAQLSPQRKGAM